MMSSWSGAVEVEGGNREVSPLQILGGTEGSLDKKGEPGGNLVSPEGGSPR